MQKKKKKASTKAALIKNVELFKKLRNEEIQIIAKNSAYYTFKESEYIFKKGSIGECLYIIKKGEVRIISRQDDEDERDVARFITGELFGELDLFEDAPRTEDAVAGKDTTLLIFPKKGKQFEDLINEHPAVFARILNKLLAQISGRIRYTNKLVSEKTPWIEDLRKQILFDKLTGLYNRNFLEEDFVTELPSYGNETSLLFIKPDNFKEINDGFGHDAGDKTLRLLADTIKEELGQGPIVVRYRGDEFTVVLPETDNKNAFSLASKVLSCIGALNLAPIIKQNNFRIRTSIGIATYPEPSKNAPELVKQAIDNMFEARNSGGNRIVNK